MADESDEHYLTTAEVARRLQVKPATIYAYVSRGLLTSVRARGRRGSLFAAADVDRLAARTVPHSGVVERIESGLTLIDNDELYYRGHSARTLATTATPESTATLLWTGQADLDSAGGPELFGVDAAGVELARVGMGVLPEGARLTDRLRVGVAVLGAADPLRFDLSVPSVTAAAGRLIGTLVDALPGDTVHDMHDILDTHDTVHDTVHDRTATLGARLWPKLTDAGPRPELLDAALILLADHGLAVSTVAARVAASARANLYAVISAGLGALDGQYHGAAPTLAYEFLGRAQQDPLKALSDQLRTGEPIPGFGHRIYQHHDPRAEVLLELLADHPIVATVRAIAERTPAFPNSDLALAALMHAYDFHPDAGDALFAIARMVGWTAHALEEYTAPALRFRTPGIYTGQTT